VETAYPPLYKHEQQHGDYETDDNHDDGLRILVRGRSTRGLVGSHQVNP
jgi:hypothetical protein